MRRRIFAAALVSVFVTSVLVAQNTPQSADMTVDAATRTSVIDGALDALNAAYVFPEVAKQMAKVGNQDAVPTGKCISAG